MHTLSRRAILFALGLTSLGGYVDAVGFLQIGQHFIAFMSGNSTQMAVGLAHGDLTQAALLGAIIMFFVIGATLGHIISARKPAARRAHSVLLFVTLGLAAAALCFEAGMERPAIFLMTVTMGSANATLSDAHDSPLGVTYMTGTLVKLGKHIAQALQGGKAFGWAPYLLLWLGLIAGGITGAALYALAGLRALWLAVLWSAALWLIAWRRSLKH